MLENIVHISNRLIKSQYRDQDSVLNQLIKLRAKKRNHSTFQSSYHQPIFEQPKFDQNIDLNIHKRKNKAYFTIENFHKRPKSQQKSKTHIKNKNFNNQKPQEDLFFTIDDNYKFNDTKKSKIIHSRKNVDSISLPKNPKVNHNRVFSKTKQNFYQKNKTLQQPDLTKLCFYKNTFQEINSKQSVKIPLRKKIPQRNFSQRVKSNRSKVIMASNKNITSDRNVDCRPWSPRNDNQSGQGDFLCFRSLVLKI